VQRVAREYLQPSKRTVGVAIPKAKSMAAPPAAVNQ
jgi:hypothetical protein